MTLLTGRGRAGLEARRRSSWTCPFLRTVVVGEPGAIDPYGYWHRVREIHEAGALLVRPDGYVAWRQTEPVWDDAEAMHQLQEALDRGVGPTGRQAVRRPPGRTRVQHPGRLTVRRGPIATPDGRASDPAGYGRDRH